MRGLRDEEIVRQVMADTSATPREKELAFRVHRLTQAYEQISNLVEADIARGEVWHGTIQ